MDSLWRKDRQICIYGFVYMYVYLLPFLCFPFLYMYVFHVTMSSKAARRPSAVWCVCSRGFFLGAILALLSY